MSESKTVHNLVLTIPFKYNVHMLLVQLILSLCLSLVLFILF